MTSLKALGRAIKTIREQVGWRTFLKLADPYLGRATDRIERAAQPDAVVVISPHPDDESIGCGGAIALHLRRGDPVHVIYTTDGGKPGRGQPVDPAQATTRKAEALRALEILGGATSDFLNLRDGEGDESNSAVQRLSQILDAKKPNRIYVPWILDKHPDHRAANRLLVQALPDLHLSPSAVVWQYEIWTPLVPNRYVPIGEVFSLKEHAIAAHQSQVINTDYVSSSLGLARFRGVQGGLKEPAEAFFAVPAGKLSLFNDL